MLKALFWNSGWKNEINFCFELMLFVAFFFHLWLNFLSQASRWNTFTKFTDLTKDKAPTVLDSQQSEQARILRKICDLYTWPLLTQKKAEKSSLMMITRVCARTKIIGRQSGRDKRLLVFFFTMLFSQNYIKWLKQLSNTGKTQGTSSDSFYWLASTQLRWTCTHRPYKHTAYLKAVITSLWCW